MNEVILEVNGMIDHYGWQRTNIKYFLNKNKGNAVRCKINSLGGSVNEAIAISKLFEAHGNVTVEFVGFCASAVTWMAFGAKSREMHEDSLWLCHKCSIPVNLYGNMNTEQLDAAIKDLENKKKNEEAINLIIAKKYADLCSGKGKNLKDVFDLLKQERWLPAEDVLAWGFIDRIIPGINKVTDEYRNLMIENCAALEFPMPVFDSGTLGKQVAEDDWASKLLNAIKTLFVKNMEDNNLKNNPKIELIMNKTFVAVNILLGVDGFNEKEGKIELTVEQVKTICNELDKLAANKKTVEDAEKILDSMSENIKVISGLSNKINAVKAVMDMLPSGTPAGTQIPPKAAVDFSEDKKDPVNDYWDNED